MDFSEEFADLLTRMAVSYEQDAKAQGKKHMGGAFLNSYQTAVYHILNELESDPTVLNRLQGYLIDMMKAFDLMARRGGVKPELTMI